MDRILIVDSSIQNTELLVASLDNGDFEIMTAESGLTAFAKIGVFHPDLVILDTDLSDMSGYDVCKRIKEDKGKYIIVLLTSFTDSRETRIRAIQVGADDFIDKMCDGFVLMSKIKSLLRVKYLADQLKSKYIELEEKNNLLNFQLKMGKSVQRSFIKKVDFYCEHIHFLSEYIPALDVGGDFYDVIALDSHRMAVVMGDVSGHGIGAALLTSMLYLMIKNLTETFQSPEKFLKDLNNRFYHIFEEGEQQLYACVFVCVVDTKDRMIYYSNAGQTLPMYLNSEKATTQELSVTGLPIGLIKDASYECNSMPYNIGDLIIFHTDGLVDVYYKNNVEAFSNKLKEIVLESANLNNANELMAMILASFYNEDASEKEKMEFDDISILICQM